MNLWIEKTKKVTRLPLEKNLNLRRKEINLVKKKQESKREEEKKIVESNTIEETEGIIIQEAEETSLIDQKALEKKQLEAIEEERKKQKTISKVRKERIDKNILENLCFGIAFLFYFIFLNLGAMHIRPEIYLVDLKVFSLVSIAITIGTYERAYHKDSGRIAIHGIELMVLSIITLIALYIQQTYPAILTDILNAVAVLYAVYFVMKSIIVHLEMKKVALKRASDIRKITHIEE